MANAKKRQDFERQGQKKMWGAFLLLKLRIASNQLPLYWSYGCSRFYYL